MRWIPVLQECECFHCREAAAHHCSLSGVCRENHRTVCVLCKTCFFHTFAHVSHAISESGGIKSAEIIQHCTHLNPTQLKTPFKPSPTSPFPSSCCGAYSRKQFLLDLTLGGTRAARMASSNTFLRPRWERQRGGGTEELLEGWCGISACKGLEHARGLQLSAPSDRPPSLIHLVPCQPTRDREPMSCCYAVKQDAKYYFIHF